MRLWQRLFHHCGEYLEYIEGTRFPETGTTGRGKVWRNYRCTVCGKLYTSSGNELCRINFPYTPYTKPIKTVIGEFYD